MKREINKRALIFIFLLLLVVVLAFFAHEWQDMSHVLALVDGEVLTFSVPSGFYEGSVSINLIPDFEIPAAAQIYYTLDGNNPTVDSNRYQKAIELTAPAEDITVYPLKAVVYYKGEYSPIVEQNYIVGNNIFDRFSLPVISITSDEDNLYDPETGIMVHYDERSEEWERQAHVTMYDTQGNVMLEQGIGLAVSGGTSARLEFKSLKLVGDLLYDDTYDKLNLQLFSQVESSPLSLVNTYNNIKLRSGSQDAWMGNIRSALMSRVADQSGFLGCSTTQRCVVYLNGTRWGVYDLQQNFTNSFLRRRFGLPDSEQIISIKAVEINFLKYGGVADYFSADLNVPENRQALEQHVDMENFLLYYAIEILANNTDWPQNNFMAWRYTGVPNPDAPYTDGRYRFILYDTDMVFSCEETPIFFEGSNQDTFRLLMDGTGLHSHSSVFPHVMESEYYRDKFLTIVSDLLNTSFQKENLLSIVDEEYARIRPETAIYNTAEDLASQDHYIALLKAAINTRETIIRQDFAEYFGMEQSYRVSVQNAEGVTLSWNQIQLHSGEAYENNYYRGTEYTISASAYPGYRFSHWVVNGMRYDGEILTVSDAMAKDGIVEIQAVSEKVTEPALVISEVSAEDGNDWIKVVNCGHSPVALRQYWLSNALADDKKFQMPAITLMPGETITVNCVNNAHTIGDYICNFNLKQGETLYLWNENTVIDQLLVPAMADGESYGRYQNSDSWVFYKNGEQRHD